MLPRRLLTESSRTIRLVVCVFDGGRRYFDLFDQPLLVRVHRVQPMDHVVLVHVRSGIAQGAERIHGIERCLTGAGQAAVDALRFVHDDDRPRRLDQVDGLFTAGLLAVLVEVVHILLVDRADGHHHDLDLRAGGEVTHLTELGGVIEEIVEGHTGIEPLEVLLGNLQGLVHAFLDRHGGDHNHELRESITLVQLEDRTQVDVSLAGAGLHFHGEVAGGERARWRQAVAELDIVEILEKLVIEQRQPVADAEVGFGHAQGQLLRGSTRKQIAGRQRRRGPHGNREFRAADLLAAEQVADSLDGLKLVIEVGFEMKLHRTRLASKGSAQPCRASTCTAILIWRGVNCRLRGFQA